MGLAFIEGGGGGGVTSDDVTASRADILSGKRDIASDSGDEIVEGTMPNNGTVNHSLPINGSFTIQGGYHSGSGKVTQSITTKAAQTYYATTADQTIASGQYLSGAQTIKKLTATNLSGENIKPGVTISVNNGSTNVWSVASTMTSKAAATYYATTSDQTIAANQFLNGAQTIKKLTQTNLTGGNIKPGVTISVNNGSANVWSVTGTMTSKAATTYYPTTSDQTIAAGQYLSGAQTIKAVSQQNLVASNIKKGVTVYVKNGNGNIFAVTGTWEGYVAEANDLYYRGIAQNIQQYTGYGDSVSFDNGQITIPDDTSAFAFVTKTAVNMTGFTKIIVEGNWRAYVSRSGYSQHPILVAELVNSATDNVSTRYLTLATQDYGTRTDTITWTSYTFTFTAQNVSKYIRLLFKNEATYGKYGGFITRIRLA